MHFETYFLLNIHRVQIKLWQLASLVLLLTCSSNLAKMNLVEDTRLILKVSMLELNTWSSSRIKIQVRSYNEKAICSFLGQAYIMSLKDGNNSIIIVGGSNVAYDPNMTELDEDWKKTVQECKKNILNSLKPNRQNPLASKGNSRLCEFSRC